MKRSEGRVRTKEEVAISVWQEMGGESVGASELELIQKAIREEFGEGAVDSPAAIARTLADAGARLRHPEILECDTRWREEKIASFVTRDEFSFTSVAEAVASVARLEELRQQFAEAADEFRLSQLRQLGLQLRREFALMTRESNEESRQILARELDQWLAVWLQTPELFADWLSLRRRSPQFIKNLGSDA